MNNAELIKALRWCQKRGCSKCVALLDNGSCKYGGAIKIFEAAANALESAEKRIARLEEDLKTREVECEVMQDQYNALLEMMQEED